MLDAFEDFEFAFQVVLLLLFQGFLNGGTTVANGLHSLAESGFCGIDFRRELTFFATCLEVSVVGLLNFRIVEFVEELFQEVEFGLVSNLTTLGYLLNSGNHFFLRLEGLLHDFLFRFSSLIYFVLHFRLSCGFFHLLNFGFGYLFVSNLRRLLKGSSFVSL